MNTRRQTDTEQSGEFYNEAQRARGADDTDKKILTDTPDLHEDETWGKASGHSGTHRGWFATAAILLGFVLGGVGLTFGPRVLLWIGVAVIVVSGATGLAMHAWTDYRKVH